MGKEEEIVKQEEAVKPEPFNNIIIETAGDDMKAMGLTTEPKEQESKSKEEDTPKEVKEEANEDEVVVKKKSRAQRKIERQNQRIRDLEEANDKLQRESKSNKTKEEVAPSPEDFETLEEYTEALEEYKIPPKDEAAEKKEDTKTSKIDARIAEMTEDGNEDHDDFDELIRAEDFPLSQELLEDVLDSEMPSEVIYYLAKNKELTKKIAKMSPKGRQKEILKVELAIESKPQQKIVKASKAPEPINALNGGSESVRTIETAQSFNEYSNLRTKQSKTGW